ncbi:chloroperoxidase-like protein [Dichomitus squalens LYAD-421 SS1]|uniref:Chloroperoxidase-like protein n=1 Tax=Dichomitus squalens (strain LYAD-421) TaxID=732165 RepID=R7SJY6_DICSQ|nr:chloroperoxidase-like protein [Dichomitus squalens LYAD-421 SS1]EJF56466.1 chloroperoxidase-like protein [Dichomitus squalens LYAD-421 SS1]
MAIVALKRLSTGLASGLGGILVNGVLFPIDFFLFLFNLLTPDHKAGRLIPEGHPGFGGKWPEYSPPQEGDSRCSCPALNAMANHGILPRSGRNITFRDLSRLVQETYNFAPTFCFFVPNYAANMLNRSYWKDSFDLSDIDAHNCIEHDASLMRVDAAEDPDQGKIAHGLVERVLAAGTGKNGNLTKKDLSRLLGQRRVEAKRNNPKFSLAFIHRIFGASNASTLLTIFGGRIEDLRPFLREERLPDGWEPRVRHRMGLTMLEFNLTVTPVELGIKEEVDGELQAAGRERYSQSVAEGKKKA